MKYRIRLIDALAVSALLLVGCRASETEAPIAASTEVLVEVAPVSRTTLHAYLTSYGTVSPEAAVDGRSAAAVSLAAPVAGIVRSVEVVEGEHVPAGKLILKLDDRIARANEQRSRAERVFAKQALQRSKTLLEQHNISQQGFEQAQQALSLADADWAAAQGVLGQLQLRSPLEGVVSRLRVVPGQAVEPNAVLAEIIDLNRLVVSVKVPVEAIAKVKVGQSADVGGEERGAARVAGTVSFVSPVVDPITGAVLVRLALPLDAGLRPGQFVKVRIAIEESLKCLAVPVESVFVDADGQSTMSVVQEGIASKIVVQLGLRDGALVEVAGADLKEGMSVVTVGSYALPDQSKVKIAKSAERAAGEVPSER